MSKRDLPKVLALSRPGVRSDVTPKALERWNPHLRAADDDKDSETSISILDAIGEDFWGNGVTANRIAAALRQIGPRSVTVNINSPGGDFWEGVTIYNLLREHPGAVNVRILGTAASAASIIAMAGDEIRIGRAASLMIHNTWVLSAGDRHSLREVADWLEPFDDAAVDVYATRTGQKPAAISQMLDAETWLMGKAAVAKGFADDLLQSDLVDQSSAKAAADTGPRAERKFDILAARAGLTKRASRDILADLKSGKPGAAPSGTPGAADITQEVRNLLAKLETI